MGTPSCSHQGVLIMFHALLICSFTDTNKPSRWSTIGGHVCQRIWNMAAATAVKPLAMYIKRSGTSQHPSKRTQSCAVARTLNGCNHRLRMDRFCFLTQICCYIHPGTNVDTTNAVEKNSIIEFLSTMGCIVLAYPRTPFFWATRLNVRFSWG